MLRLDGVTKSFGAITAVRNVSFTASPGEVVGYLGPNGSGKSTTVKMIAGLIEPTRGRVLFGGRDIQENLLEHRRRIGYVPETPHLYTYLTGPEYLTLVGRLRHLPASLLEAKIDRFLSLFGIEGDRYAPLSAYSKGMKQKILISAALLHDPEIVILDEPSSGLDVSSTLVLKHLIKALAAHGKVVLYSSHVLELVEQVCSRIVILKEGSVVAAGEVADLRRLIGQPSLERVFTELAVRDDPTDVAHGLIEAMKLAP